VRPTGQRGNRRSLQAVRVRAGTWCRGEVQKRSAVRVGLDGYVLIYMQTVCADMH